MKHPHPAEEFVPSIISSPKHNSVSVNPLAAKVAQKGDMTYSKWDNMAQDMAESESDEAEDAIEAGL